MNRKYPMKLFLNDSCWLRRGLACALWVGSLHVVGVMGQAFTYQGRLTDADIPANGDYDLKFSLYDDAGAGNQVGDSITNAPVAVSNGLFTVTMDFGPAIFDGSPRWLEIGVATGGSGEFIVLSPRQALTPTPYAIHADTASGTIPGAVVTSLNTLKDDITLEAGTNVTITPNGNSLTISSAGAGGSGIWEVNANNAYYNAGSVGVGTSTPRGALHVASGGLAVTGASSPYTGAGLGVFLESGGNLGQLFAYDYSAGAARSLILNSPGGNVGIGTITPASKLTVRTTGIFAGYGIEHTDGTVRLTTYLDGNSGWLGTRSAHGLNFFINDGLPSMAIDVTGSVVITPNGGTGGYGSTTFGTPNGESGLTIKGSGGSPNRADLRFNGSTIKLVAGSGVGPPSSLSGIAVATTGNVGIGTDTPGAKLDVVGDASVSGGLYVGGAASVCAITIRGGCDLAEPFPTKEAQLEKGSVLVIDDEHPGRLQLSTRACDTRVAGVISGANGVNTGIALQQEGTFDQGQNVALSGRVYVRADATFGAIKPGDLLTTSDTPGHAMKVTDHLQAQGAILGKAMSALDDGRGFVLVLVTLQ